MIVNFSIQNFGSIKDKQTLLKSFIYMGVLQNTPTIYQKATDYQSNQLFQRS